MTLITLTLTCKDQVGADQITQALLAESLIACAKSTHVSPIFYWKGSIETSEETLLIMESTLEKFDQIETVIKQLHSYETFVLQAYPILKTSAGVTDWVKEALEKPNSAV